MNFQRMSRETAVRLLRFPWRSTALTLRERFRDDRLGVTASSLTFTTTIALVPLFTVALAVFTAFPMFSQVQTSLQAWLVQSLIPDAIAKQVLGYLTQFSSKASRLGAAGLVLLVVSALALVLTIDRTLNSIWRVRRPRPLTQRVLIYWAVLTLGPLVLGASLWITTYLLSASKGWVGTPGGLVRFVLDALELVMLAAAFFGLYRWVPNAPVQPGHAWAGAIFATLGLELGRKLLAVYLSVVPSYSAVYGALATLPILLIWIYIGWVVVLLGAVVTAYLPALSAGTARRDNGPSWRYELAVEVLQRLHAVRGSEARGLSLPQLAAGMQVDPLQIEDVLDLLVDLDWVGRLAEADTSATPPADGVVARTIAPRHVLLADPEATPLTPLVRALLVSENRLTAPLWQDGGLGTLRLAQVLRA